MTDFRQAREEEESDKGRRVNRISLEHSRSNRSTSVRSLNLLSTKRHRVRDIDRQTHRESKRARKSEREGERERSSVRGRAREKESEHKIEEATLERVEHELGRLHASRRNTHTSYDQRVLLKSE